jgi:hypothetical protein
MLPSGCCTVACSGAIASNPRIALRARSSDSTSINSASSEQEHDHGRFGPLPDQDRAGHRDGHQRIHVQVAVLERDPALLVGGPATGGDRHQRETR